MLELGEVGELCLGYAATGNPGSGSGRKLAKLIADGMATAIGYGMRDVTHFEQIQIFSVGIGPDRISDATAGIIRHELALYTEREAERLGIPVKDRTFGNAIYSFDEGRWIARRYRLPVNPYTNNSILLVPKYYLRPLPTINSDDFWQFACDKDPGTIAKEFGDVVGRKVDKEMIIQLAIKHSDLREKYVAEKEIVGSTSYDFDGDPAGFHRPYLVANAFISGQIAKGTIETSDQLLSELNGLVDRFPNYIENNSGWDLLWNDDGSPKNEHAFQASFIPFLLEFARQRDVDLAREPNIGRGPVDFKLSRGATVHVLIEAKRANNSAFWHGLEAQLVKYLEAESISHGIFLIALQRESDFARLPALNGRVNELNKKHGISVIAKEVDCTNDPPSASKLRVH